MENLTLERRESTDTALNPKIKTADALRHRKGEMKEKKKSLDCIDILLCLFVYDLIKTFVLAVLMNL